MTSSLGKPFVVMFHSHKGGVGRTAALVNTALLLARDCRRVLLVDLDVDAPGIRFYPGFEPPEGAADAVVEGIVGWLFNAAAAPPQEGVLTELLDSAAYSIDGTKWLRPSHAKFGEIRCIDAGSIRKSDRERIASLRLHAPVYDPEQLHWGKLLKETITSLAFAPDYVLIDCRPGLGGISLLAEEAADACVLLSNTSRQSMSGVATMISSLRPKLGSKQLLVFSPVPYRDDIDAKSISERASMLLKAIDRQPNEGGLEVSIRQLGLTDSIQHIDLRWFPGLALKEWHLGEVGALTPRRLPMEIGPYEAGIIEISNWIQCANHHDPTTLLRTKLARLEHFSQVDLRLRLLNEYAVMHRDNLSILSVAVEEFLSLDRASDATALLERFQFPDGDPPSEQLRTRYASLTAQAHLLLAANADREEIVEAARVSAEKIKSTLPLLRRATDDEPMEVATLCETSLFLGKVMEAGERILTYAGSLKRLYKTSDVDQRTFADRAKRLALAALPDEEKVGALWADETIGRWLVLAYSDRHLDVDAFVLFARLSMYPPLRLHKHVLPRTREVALSHERVATGWDVWVGDLRYENPLRRQGMEWLPSVLDAMVRPGFTKMRYLVAEDSMPDEAVETIISEMREHLQESQIPNFEETLGKFQVRAAPASYMSRYLEADAYVYSFEQYLTEGRIVDPELGEYLPAGTTRYLAIGRPWRLPTAQRDTDWVLLESSTHGSAPEAVNTHVRHMSEQFERVWESARPIVPLEIL